MTANKNESIDFRGKELFNALIRTSSLSDFFKYHEESFITEDFAAYLRKMVKRMGMVREHVIKRANIERTYGHQIFEGRRKPSRDKVIQLCFGMKLNAEETQNLLLMAGHGELFPCVRRDAIIIFAIHNKIGFVDTQVLLDSYGQKLIGEN